MTIFALFFFDTIIMQVLVEYKKAGGGVAGIFWSRVSKLPVFFFIKNIEDPIEYLIIYLFNCR
jgi:hypothetical protein